MQKALEISRAIQGVPEPGRIVVDMDNTIVDENTFSPNDIGSYIQILSRDCAVLSQSILTPATRIETPNAHGRHRNLHDYPYALRRSKKLFEFLLRPGAWTRPNDSPVAWICHARNLHETLFREKRPDEIVEEYLSIIMDEALQLKFRSFMRDLDIVLRACMAIERRIVQTHNNHRLLSTKHV